MSFRISNPDSVDVNFWTWRQNNIYFKFKIIRKKFSSNRFFDSKISRNSFSAKVKRSQAKNEKVTLGTKRKKEQNFDSFAWVCWEVFTGDLSFYFDRLCTITEESRRYFGWKANRSLFNQSTQLAIFEKKTFGVEKFRREIFWFHDREQIWPNSWISLCTSGVSPKSSSSFITT